MLPSFWLQSGRRGLVAADRWAVRAHSRAGRTAASLLRIIHSQCVCVWGVRLRVQAQWPWSQRRGVRGRDEGWRLG